MSNSKYLHMFNVFFKIGLFTIGGGLAMIPVIRDEFVALLNSDYENADRIKNEFEIDAVNLCVSDNPFFVTPETANILQIIMKLCK